MMLLLIKANFSVILSDNCISLNKNCDSNSSASVDIQKITVDKMINEFDDELSKNAEYIDKMIVSVTTKMPETDLHHL